MSATISLNLAPRVEELKRLYDAVESLGEQEDWPASLIFQVNLVLEELGINIMNYGETADDQEIIVCLTSKNDALTIYVSDAGKPFNPLTDGPDPNVSKGLDERPIGGLGVYLVRTLMDELSYQREGDRNHLTLVKHRSE